MKVNPTFEVSENNNDVILAKVDGEFKKIITDQEIFFRTIDMINKSADYTKVFLDEGYLLEDINEFINTLIKEKILLKDEEENIQSIKVINILLCGKGKMYETFKKKLNKLDFFCVTEHKKSNFDINDYAKLVISKNIDVIVFLPSTCTYSEIFNFNRYALKESIPFFIAYYDGEYIILGPFVFPWKTPCLECLLTHRLKMLDLNLSIDKDYNLIKSMRFSNELPDYIPSSTIEYYADRAIADLIKTSKKSEGYYFVGKEEAYNVNRYYDYEVREYSATTYCNGCHGTNKNYKEWYDELKLDFIKNKKGDIIPIFKKNPIKYLTGGFRSLDSNETKLLVESAIENAGLKVEISRLESTDLFKFLPSYRSYLEPAHHNKTPYFFSITEAHGKGMTEEQAYLSAAFEMIEYISSFHVGDLEIICATPKDVEKYSIDLKEIKQQIYNENTAYDKINFNEKIDWVWATSLIDGRKVLVPATMVFLGNNVMKGLFYSASSSGLAAGATLEDAILQGLFEVIEHDAWMIGQSNNIVLPIVNYSTSKNQLLLNVIEEIKDAGYQIISRDYTNDLGFPVIRTWIVNPNDFTHYACNGFGASISMEIALERSVTEAVQSSDIFSSKRRTRFSRVKSKSMLYSKDSIYGMYYFLQKDIKTLAKKKSITHDYDYSNKSVSEILHDTIKKIKVALPSSNVLYVDLTKKGLDIPAVRVIVTGDIQRLNLPLTLISQRMLNYQKIMGYSNKALSYDELYMGPYPH